MEGPTSDKLAKLFALLEREPRDPFLLYGVGMEYKKLEAPDRAIEYFDRTIHVDPGYCYAYFQKGQIQERRGNLVGAREAFREGIEAAQRAGDAHAAEELKAALDMISDG